MGDHTDKLQTSLPTSEIQKLYDALVAEVLKAELTEVLRREAKRVVAERVGECATVAALSLKKVVKL